MVVRLFLWNLGRILQVGVIGYAGKRFFSDSGCSRYPCYTRGKRRIFGRHESVSSRVAVSKGTTYSVLFRGRLARQCLRGMQSSRGAISLSVISNGGEPIMK